MLVLVITIVDRTILVFLNLLLEFLVASTLAFLSKNWFCANTPLVVINKHIWFCLKVFSFATMWSVKQFHSLHAVFVLARFRLIIIVIYYLWGTQVVRSKPRLIILQWCSFVVCFLNRPKCLELALWGRGSANFASALAKPINLWFHFNTCFNSIIFINNVSWLARRVRLITWQCCLRESVARNLFLKNSAIGLSLFFLQLVLQCLLLFKDLFLLNFSNIF